MSTYENTISANFLSQFKSCTHFYARFHLIFLSCIFLELISFLLFFSYFSKSATSAFAFALFFLTIFSYFVLLSFFQTKKSGQLLSFRDEFSSLCKKLNTHENTPAYLTTVKACSEAFSLLTQEELLFYAVQTPLDMFNPLIAKLRVKLHWKNFHAMKELLLILSIKELIAFIKKEPSDLEAHSSLAEVYSQLSQLYLHPNKLNSFPIPWIPAEYSSNLMQQKFLACSERAVQELKILQDYDYENPWIHAKLAEIYHYQGNAEEEIKQYEKLLEISSPSDEVLFRLGVLYFKQGYNAKGLKIYEKLQKMSSKKSDSLIIYYDAYPFYELSCLFSLDS